MRLTEQESHAIVAAAVDVFGVDAQVALFGSRVDDRRRGGDVDLLVHVPEALDADSVVRRRARFVAMLWRQFGERRIDVVVWPMVGEELPPIVEAARRQAVPLRAA
jgi:predicted nucleotidyltransferase